MQSAQNTNIQLIPPVTPAPIGFDWLQQIQPKPMERPDAKMPTQEEWRKDHPKTDSPKVVPVEPRKNKPQNLPKKDIVLEVPPHQETKTDEGPGLVPKNGLAAPPFFF